MEYKFISTEKSHIKAIIPQLKNYHLIINLYYPVYNNLSYGDMQINITNNKLYSPTITIFSHDFSEIKEYILYRIERKKFPDYKQFTKPMKLILQNKDNLNTIQTIIIQTYGV